MLTISPSTLITHLAGWILFLSLPVIFVSNMAEREDFLSTLSSLETWLFFAAYVFLFYFHSYFLLPRFYFRGRYIMYGFFLLSLLASVWFLQPFDRMISKRRPFETGKSRPSPRHSEEINPPQFDQGNHPPPRHRDRMAPRVDVVSIFLFLLVLAMSLAIVIRQRWRMAEQRALLAEADRTQAELSFLKAQVNPHFLFNTLNNIYSLASAGSEKTAESIMKLSNIMRYVTDEGREEYVPLENEIAFLQDYIDLQKLRITHRTRVEFAVNGPFGGRKIAPLILITFIENVFKYGVSSHEPTDILISINVLENQIDFFCQNKLFDSRRQREGIGIGIKNTRQRLEHLYPGRHNLLISREAGKFTVQLSLQEP